MENKEIPNTTDAFVSAKVIIPRRIIQPQQPHEDPEIPISDIIILQEDEEGTTTDSESNKSTSDAEN